MKLLFVHDHPFYRSDEDVVYSGGGLPSIIWGNYLMNFEKVMVYGRRSYKDKDRKVRSSFPNVEFYLTENYSSPKSYFLNQNKIIKELEELLLSVDVVLVRLPSFLGFLAAKVARRLDKRVWVEQVGSTKEALASHGSILGLFSSNYFEYVNKKNVKEADFVSYVTKYKLQCDYPKNIKAISCSISNVFIDEILDKHAVNQDRFYNDYLKIGLIGGFDVKYKGQDVLLKAISLLDKSVKEKIRISLIGKGEYQWILDLADQLKVRENIIFVGSLKPGVEIKNELKTLGLYVQASITEGMPRATIEAMAMGCPVIGSNAGGIPDVVSKDYVHKKGDYKKLAEDIKKMFFNRSILSIESNLSIIKADEYSIENIQTKRNNFYEQINKIID